MTLEDDTGIPEIDPYETPLELLRQVPLSIAVRFSVFPLGKDSDGRLLLASNDLLAPSEVQEIEQALSHPVEMCLATQADVAFAIRRGYERLTGEPSPAPDRPKIGARLLARRMIDADQLAHGLHVQRRSYARLGDLLVEQRAMSAEALAQALPEFLAIGKGRLGDFLVERGYVTRDQVDRALEEQRQRSPRLGELLTRLGHITGPLDDD